MQTIPIKTRLSRVDGPACKRFILHAIGQPTRTTQGGPKTPNPPNPQTPKTPKTPKTPTPQPPIKTAPAAPAPTAPAPVKTLVPAGAPVVAAVKTAGSAGTPAHPKIRGRARFCTPIFVAGSGYRPRSTQSLEVALETAAQAVAKAKAAVPAVPKTAPVPEPSAEQKEAGRRAGIYEAAMKAAAGQPRPYFIKTDFALFQQFLKAIKLQKKSQKGGDKAEKKPKAKKACCTPPLAAPMPKCQKSPASPRPAQAAKPQATPVPVAPKFTPKPLSQTESQLLSKFLVCVLARWCFFDSNDDLNVLFEYKNQNYK
jgi:hypothetical protein